GVVGNQKINANGVLGATGALERMRFQIKYLVSGCVRAVRKRLAKQLVRSLHRVLPVTESDIQPESRELRIRVGRGPGKSVARSTDPGNGVLRSSTFAESIND